jgi:hypothetical protein
MQQTLTPLSHNFQNEKKKSMKTLLLLPPLSPSSAVFIFYDNSIPILIISPSASTAHHTPTPTPHPNPSPKWIQSTEAYCSGGRIFHFQQI